MLWCQLPRFGGFAVFVVGLLAGCGDAFEAGGAGAGTASGGAEVPCGNTHSISNEFEDSELSPVWEAGGSDGSVRYEGGQLVLAPSPDGSASFRADHAVRLKESVARLEVSQADTTNGYFGMSLSGGGGGLNMQAQGGDLFIDVDFPGGEDGPSARLPYDPEKQRFWQIREADGQLHFETSADGQTFESHLGIDTPSFTESLSFRIWAAAYSSGKGLDVRFAGFNSGLSAPWCAVTSLVDAFADGEAAAAWYDGKWGLCASAESQGKLDFILGPASGERTEGQCNYSTLSAYRLTGDSATVRFGASPQAGLDIDRFLYITDLVGGTARLSHSGSRSTMATSSTLNLPGDADDIREDASGLSFDPAADAWWRIREEDAVIYFDTSPDGSSWTPKGQAGSNLNTDAVHVVFGAHGEDLTMTVPVEVLGYNTPP